jgi:hypothetical protein
MGVIIEY